MLQVEQTSVRRGNRILLNRVSCAVHLEKITAVLGENGAGKSTLLKVLSNETQPQEGRASLNGVSLANIPSLILARQRAVMPQSSSMDFGFRVEEIVAMGRTPFETILPPIVNQSIVIQAMHWTGIMPLRYRLYPSLSGGEKQRVQFARSLAQILDPRPFEERYLLLDEPLSNMDLRFQHELMQSLHRLSRTGVGVLIVLHDLNLAALYADRMIVLKDGCILSEGAFNQVLHPLVIEAAFSYPVTITKHPSLDRPWVIPSVKNDRK